MFLFGGVSARESTEKAKCMHEQQDRGGGVEERGVERVSARRSSLKEQERVIVSQNIGTVSKAAVGKGLRDRVERIWAFPSG